MLARSIGEQLTELRWKQRFTVAEVAAVVGLSTEYLQRVEAGEVDLDMLTLNRLTEILGISCTELFQLAEQRAKAAKSAHFFNVAECDLPQPKSIADYREVLAWYRARQQQYAWLRAKREQERRNLAKKRNQLRLARLAWKQQRKLTLSGSEVLVSRSL